MFYNLSSMFNYFILFLVLNVTNGVTHSSHKFIIDTSLSIQFTELFGVVYVYLHLYLQTSKKDYEEN